ncbi:uncharacterized protein HaLaN_12393, partial [Haematococcus lacustris]
ATIAADGAVRPPPRPSGIAKSVTVGTLLREEGPAPLNHMWRILIKTGIAPPGITGAEDDDKLPAAAGVVGGAL